MSWTWTARMSRLTRGPPFSGAAVAFIGRRMATLLLCVEAPERAHTKSPVRAHAQRTGQRWVTKTPKSIDVAQNNRRRRPVVPAREGGRPIRPKSTGFRRGRSWPLDCPGPSIPGMAVVVSPSHPVNSSSFSWRSAFRDLRLPSRARGIWVSNSGSYGAIRIDAWAITRFTDAGGWPTHRGSLLAETKTGRQL